MPLVFLTRDVLPDQTRQIGFAASETLAQNMGDFCGEAFASDLVSAGLPRSGDGK